MGDLGLHGDQLGAQPLPEPGRRHQVLGGVEPLGRGRTDQLPGEELLAAQDLLDGRGGLTDGPGALLNPGGPQPLDRRQPESGGHQSAPTGAPAAGGLSTSASPFQASS